jgi:hypothetical protein
LAYISDPAKQTNDATRTAEPVGLGQGIFQLDIKTFLGGHILKPDSYRLGLKLVASNHPPREYTLLIRFPGKWFDDQDQMFSDGFGMEIQPASKWLPGVVYFPGDFHVPRYRAARPKHLE